MEKYLSLHIGVNRVGEQEYGMTSYEALYGCVNDANVMASIACANGFAVKGVLKDEQATFDAVVEGIEYAIKNLQEGGTFLLTFSGHGAQLTTIDPNDEYKYDEGFVLHDIVMKDNYLNVFLRQFKQGTRVIIVADCCHSRTIYSFGNDQKKNAKEPLKDDGSGDPCRKNRRLKLEASEESNRPGYNRYKALDTEYRERSRAISKNINADVIVLSACDDDEVAVDGAEYGLFTEAILGILRSGYDRKGIPFTGSYRQLIDEAKRIIYPRTKNAQVPQITFLGPNEGNEDYPLFQGPPFTIFK